MNRIIFVGNGFDLAHRLKTKYEDFITWYLLRLNKISKGNNSLKSDGLVEFKTKKTLDTILNYFKGNESPEKMREYASSGNIDIKISLLLCRILKSIQTKGWVDIEADYYAMLVECKGKKEELKRLNKDFAIIQGLLVEYLNEIQKELIDGNIFCDNIREAMLSPFSINEIAVSSEKKWWDFVEKRSRESIIYWKSFLLGYLRPDLLRKIGRVRYE